MVGIKGKSGRKKREDGKKMKAVSFYIEMEQIDVNHINNPKGAKYKWIPQEWFRQYKKVFGSNWQKVTRSIMMDHLSNYELSHMWDCNCNTRMEKWHRKTEGECNRCGYTPNQIQRFKNINAARIANTEKKTRLETPLTKCSCGEILIIKEVENLGKIYQCPKCTRGGF